MKFKVGDKVIRTECVCVSDNIKQGNTYIVQKIHKEAGFIYLEGIFDSNGNLDWFNPDNFELVKENTPKFKKGDKSIHVSLEEVYSTPNENVFELYEQEDKNYRHLSPDTLIPISIDGVESEVPLGDLVHATALLGMTNGTYGCRLWTKLEGLFDNDDDVIGDSYSSVVKFEEQKVLFSKFFLDPKKEQQKEDIKKTILAKETELKVLQSQLKELD